MKPITSNGLQLSPNGMAPMTGEVPVRRMVAVYDYDPQELSPNVDAEVSQNINPIALRRAKTLWSFGLSECTICECNRVEVNRYSFKESNSASFIFAILLSRD